ncbi:MAG TPA: ABC transporter substrate-binding protein [Vicinamibacteria bacterium]|nr:ABC transporter substrate-binding protein [Vicinamibacteria bacterium]
MRVRLAVAGVLLCPLASAQSPPPDLLQTDHDVGGPGGRLVFALRSEPKTLNPVAAVDSASRDVIGRMTADLIHIDRQTQRTTPALARSWTISPDGRRYTIELRRGLRFSDGHPLDADDVVFTFRCYLDERNGSPQRDLLVVGGKPVVVRKLDPSRLELEMEQPYAAAERLFDSVAILPRHLLEDAQREGRLAQAWGLGTPPREIAGLGPFRLKAYLPGDRLVLERNPHYWKVDRAGGRLPYLDEIVFLLVPSEDAQVIRFKAGETDLVSRIGAENFGALSRETAPGRYRLEDLGPGLEYSFLLFNLNETGGAGTAAVSARPAWLKQTLFRQAISVALDRPGLVRLVYQGRATALGTHVPPGNKLWANAALGPPTRSPSRARELLSRGGFSWSPEGKLRDAGGTPVELTIITGAANAPRVQMATIIQDDLRQLGMSVQVVPLENRAVLDRVLRSHDYDTALMALASGDVDPTSEMNLWLSSGATHLWHLGQSEPATPWEKEIDELMRRQLVTLDPRERKRCYDRVQELAAENLPLIPLVSPDVLVGAREGLGNFRPAILDHNVLWNADELFWGPPPSRR